MCWDWALSKLSDKLLHMYASQNVLLSSQDIQSPLHTPTGNGLLPYAWLLFTMTKWGRMFQALCNSKLWKFVCQKWQANHTQNAGKTETSILSKLVANGVELYQHGTHIDLVPHTSSHILILFSSHWEVPRTPGCLVISVNPTCSTPLPKHFCWRLTRKVQ